jgi:glycosyltransferase involved in cell wall biosynthesis
MESGNEIRHLAYVVHTLNPGGTERLVVDMSLSFSESYQVTVFCLDEPGAWASVLREQGIPVICLWRQPGFDLSTATSLAKYFRQLNVDIVHAHQCTPWFYAALSRIRFRRPRLLLEEHGRFFPETENRLRWWVNRLLIRKLTHAFVAVSNDIRDRLVRYEGLDHDEIEVVYNGIAEAPRISEKERFNMRSALGLSKDQFVVGTVGRFDKIKNLPMLVGSLNQAISDCSAVRGLIVGDGPEFADIETLINSTEAVGHIRLTGYRSDARALAQCMDLFVLSSFSEGISMALLEAMAGGVPVAVTAVGGNVEIVHDSKTGWVVPSDDSNALAAVIKEAWSERQKAEKIGAAGSKRVADEFSFAGMIGKYGDVYRLL